MSILKNLAKSAIAVAATPIAFVVDVVHLPSSAYYNGDPLERTKAIARKASDAFDEAIKPERKQ